MSAYIVVQVKVEDPVKYEQYKRQVPATIEAYGGRFLVRGGDTEVLEGDWNPERFVILEFDSVERAKAWWSSEEYRHPKELRQQASKANLIIAAGV